MNNINAYRVITDFLNFFKKRGHSIRKSAPLISSEKELLFVNAGIIPFKNYFFQTDTQNLKLASTQECIRTIDIDSIGESDSHLTFFRMNGNFSFNNYFKETAINYALEYLVDFLKLPKDRLYITLHEDDIKLSYHFTDFPKKNIILTRENIWTTGMVGPFGRCLEFYYDFGEIYGDNDINNSKRFLEIWNIVFADSISDQAGNFQRKGEFFAIDTGSGLERILTVLNKTNSVFSISPYKELISAIKDSTTKFQSREKTMFKRVIVDHAITAMKIIENGIVPSNTLHGYILRKLLRKIFINYTLLGLDLKELFKFNSYMYSILQSNDYCLNFSNITLKKLNKIEEKEFKAFELVYKRGVNYLFEKIDKNKISGHDLFYLHDTMGFSIDLSKYICTLHNITIDETGFQKELTHQKLQSQHKQKGLGGASLLTTEKTIRVNEINCNAKIIALEEYKEASEEKYFTIILDRTSFLPEEGGSISDIGEIIGRDFSLKVESVVKKNNVIYHNCKVINGVPKKDQSISLKINLKHRFMVSQSHTAVHILKAFLEKRFSARQDGSKNKAGSFTFDFFLPSEETIDIEVLEMDVNKIINQKLPITTAFIDYNDALTLKKDNIGEATALQDSHQIRKVEIESVSKELCNGKHTENTSEIQMLFLTKISKIKQSTYRIEGVVGEACFNFYRDMVKSLQNTSQFLSLKDKNPLSLINSLKEKIEKIGNETKNKDLHIREYVLYLIKETINIGAVEFVHLPYRSLRDQTVFNFLIQAKKRFFSYEIDEEKASIIVSIFYSSKEDEEVIKNIASLAYKKWGKNHLQQFLLKKDFLKQLLNLNSSKSY